MIVSFVKARQCAHCKRQREKNEQDWGSVQFSMAKGLLRWFQPRFAICPTCFDEMVTMAEKNPGLSIKQISGDKQ
jgi:hypothetical protein